MHKIIVFLSLVTFVVGYHTVTNDVNKDKYNYDDLINPRQFEYDEGSPTPALTQGQVAVIGQFPSSVTIETPFINIQNRCGGVLIDDRHVVTAAFCCVNGTNHLINPFWFRVTMGDLNLFQPTINRIQSNVTHNFVNNQFNPQTRDNGLCVLRLGTPIQLPHNTVEPALRQTRIQPVGTQCQIGAWGSAVAANAVDPELRFLAQPILDPATCNTAAVHGGAVLQSMMCAGALTAGPGHCGGAIGSGLFCNRLLTGILINVGNGCGAANSPSVYLQVRMFDAWINAQLVRTDNPMPGTPIVQPV